MKTNVNHQRGRDIVRFGELEVGAFFRNKDHLYMVVPEFEVRDQKHNAVIVHGPEQTQGFFSQWKDSAEVHFEKSVDITTGGPR